MCRRGSVYYGQLGREREEETDGDEGREKTTATETPQRAINKFDTRAGKLAKLPASGVSI